MKSIFVFPFYFLCATGSMAMLSPSKQEITKTAEGVAAAAARGWDPISANFLQPKWVRHIGHSIKRDVC